MEPAQEAGSAVINSIGPSEYSDGVAMQVVLTWPARGPTSASRMHGAPGMLRICPESLRESLLSVDSMKAWGTSCRFRFESKYGVSPVNTV